MPDRSVTLTRLATAGMLVAAIDCGHPPPSSPPVAPLRVERAPGAARYQIVQRRHVEQTVQGQLVVADVSTSAVFGVTVRAGISGATDRALDVVVDSVRASGFGSQEAEDPVGIRFTFQIGPNGYLQVPQTAGDAGPLAEQLAQLVPTLLPPIPTQGIAPGQAWEDTTSLQIRSGGMALTIRARTLHRAGEWTTMDGVQVLEVTGHSAYHLTGEGERNGQWISMTGSGSSLSTCWIAAGGYVEQGMQLDSLRVNVKVGGTGLTIPIQQTAVDSVRRVR